MNKATWSISGFNRSHWLAKDYVPDALKERLTNTDILLLPQDGFRHYSGPLYPVCTEEFLAFLIDASEGQLGVDVVVSDDNYKELALHADLLVLASVVFSSFSAPIVVNLISEYLKKKFNFDTPRHGVRVKLHVQIGEGETARSVDLEYEGSVVDFESSINIIFAEVRGQGYEISMPTEACKALEEPRTSEVSVDVEVGGK